MKARSLIAPLALFAWTGGALAEEAFVEAAWIEGDVVHVTLSHPDSGWDHYADGWEVITAKGERLGLRVLAHPHVDEQPFTRSLRLAHVPEGMLFVRTRCSVDGWGETRTEILHR